ncbi:MAG: Gfo/Idh/MocA family oxidoreductase [Pseudomonadota bacterium]
MTLRYGVIGTGSMGQEHIRNLTYLDGVEVVAIADPDAGMRQKAEAATGLTAYSDYRDLIGSVDIDALVIATPNHTHRSVLKDVLATDLPVLVEKPLCSTVEDCQAVITIAKGRRAPVWVAMEYRFMPPVARMLEELDKGAAGRLRMLAIREHRFPFLDKVGAWNRFGALSGGTMVEKCCHFFDLMRLITKSEPIRLWGSGAQDVNHLDEAVDGNIPDVIDNAFVTVDFANGTRALLDLCMFAEASRDQEEIVATGDEGKVECGIPSSRLSIGKRGTVKRMGITLPMTTETVPVDPHLLEIGDHHGATYFEHMAFRDMVRSKGEPAVTLEDGLAAVAMGQAAEKSIKDGIPITF